MSKPFSSRKRLIGLGLVGAFIVALAVLGTLWGLGRTASADPDGLVRLVHVNEDGSDFTGNPVCDPPDTQWDNGKVVGLNPRHYCNNVTSRNHVIRTEGFDLIEEWGGEAWPYTCPDENFDCVHKEGVGEILLVDYCYYIPEAHEGPNWNHKNDWELCILIHSKDPGETTISFSYYDYLSDYDYTTTPLVKEWRKLEDTVILKTGDLKLLSLPTGSKVWMPLDADGDGDRDTDDEHLLNHDGEVQNHSVVLDETTKGMRSASGPIWLVDVVHGAEKAVDPTFHDPVEGAVVLAFIDSPRHCTYFTNPTFTVDTLITVPANSAYYGTAMAGITNAQGQFVGPLPWPVGAQLSDEAKTEAAAHLLHEGMSNTGDPPYRDLSGNIIAHLGVYVDTICEETATITFKVGYPGHVGSSPQFPEPESVTINWTTLELFKQPQIRWAGEEIVLATRWALPDEWYPNINATTKYPQPICPLATSQFHPIGWYFVKGLPYPVPEAAVSYHVNYVRKDPSPGSLQGAYVDEDGDGSLDALAFMGASEARGDIDDSCVSKALADSETPGQMDVEAKLVEQTWLCDPQLVPIDDDKDSTATCDCTDEDPIDGLDNDTGCCATAPDCDLDGDGDCSEEDELVLCDNADDDDGDTFINDGCPAQGYPLAVPETGDECLNALDDEDPEVGFECANNVDDDGDGYVNDGCPAEGDPESGDECLNNTDDEYPEEGAIPEDFMDCASDNYADDDGDGYVNDGCAANGEPERGDQCTETVCDDSNNYCDDDDDGYANDGCPARGDGYVNDGCPPYADGYVNDGCPTVGDGLVDEDPPNPVEISYDPDAHKFICEYPLFVPYGLITSTVKVSDAELQSEVLINKHPFLVWFLKMYEVKLTNVPGARAEHNAGKFTAASGADLYDPSVGDTVADTLNVSADALLRVTVKGWFHGANNSAHGPVCIDMDGDGDGDPATTTDVPGEPYPQPVIGGGCPDPQDEPVEQGFWVMPDDFVTAASAEDAYNITGGMLASLDVMSDISDSPGTAGAVGPKSTLDSHDTTVRPWIPCLVGACPRKTVDPDGEITVADAIMPPLKIRAQIAGAAGETHANDAGFLKGADKDDDVGIASLYQKIMIPADPEIPPFILGGGYDWDSWFCRIEDGNIPSPYDADGDGVSDWNDNCREKANPNQYDFDGDCPFRPYIFGDPKCGDACDSDIDGDLVANVDDGCDYDPTITTCTVANDSDGDTTPDACDIDAADPDAKDEDADQDGVKDTSDNCPTISNPLQGDFDKDGAGDECDGYWSGGPFVKLVAPMYACPNAYLGLQEGPYEFYHILQPLPVTACPDLAGELCNAKLGNQIDQSPNDVNHPRLFEFYTDNRGQGYFFANGDYNLDFGECRIDLVSGAPDCKPGDVVGESNIKVIGQYPYTRAPEKLRNVISNPVVKTWEWDGYKKVTSVRVDPAHIYIIAHLKDRDGICKWDVKTDPTAKDAVVFSPSEHEVQHEWVEFYLNTDVGSILQVSPNGLLVGDDPTLDPHVHTPLGKTRATGLEDGVIVNPRKAIARAEDARILDYYDKAHGVTEGLVDGDACEAWILIEHPIDQDPDVSVVFNDPEGKITRHWPPSTHTFYLVGGPSADQKPPLWNDTCYVGSTVDIVDALDPILCPEGQEAAVTAEGVLACDETGTPQVLAVYRLKADQTWDTWFPEDPAGKATPVLSSMTEFNPYDQLFILMSDSVYWEQEVTVDAKAEQVALVNLWNSVCYAGNSKTPDAATAGITNDIEVVYQLGLDQMWRRYVPGMPEIPDTLITLDQYTSVVMLVTTAAGTTWVFDP